MGGKVIINDTLQITSEQGFPKELNLEKHRSKPITLEDVKDKVFSFTKLDARLYQLAPTRCFLVHNIDGLWLYWGKIIMVEQTIKYDGKKSTTSGKFKIIQMYDPEYQREFTLRECPEGSCFFK